MYVPALNLWWGDSPITVCPLIAHIWTYFFLHVSGSFSNNPSIFSISAVFCLFRNKLRKGLQKHRCFSAESPLCNCCPFYYSVGSELQGFLPTVLQTALCAIERKKMKEGMGEVGSRKKNSREVESLKFQPRNNKQLFCSKPLKIPWSVFSPQ